MPVQFRRVQAATTKILFPSLIYYLAIEVRIILGRFNSVALSSAADIARAVNYMAVAI